MDEQILAVQTAFPQIYIACHVEHRTKKSPTGLTSRHGSILAHIGKKGVRPSDLAQHMSVRRSTMSETLKGLKNSGFVELIPDPDDGRRKTAILTDKGHSAVSISSVLDTDRLRLLLSVMAPSDRKKAIQGLELLAQAAEKIMEERGS